MVYVAREGVTRTPDSDNVGVESAGRVTCVVTATTVEEPGPREMVWLMVT